MTRRFTPRANWASLRHAQHDQASYPSAAPLGIVTSLQNRCPNSTRLAEVPVNQTGEPLTSRSYWRGLRGGTHSRDLQNTSPVTSELLYYAPAINTRMHSGLAIQARRIGATESSQLLTAVSVSHFRGQNVGGVSLTSDELGVWPSTIRHELRTSLYNYPASSAFATKLVWDYTLARVQAARYGGSHSGARPLVASYGGWRAAERVLHDLRYVVGQPNAITENRLFGTNG